MATNNDTTMGVIVRSDYDDRMAQMGQSRDAAIQAGPWDELPTDGPGQDDDDPDTGPQAQLGSRVWLTWLKREGFVIKLPVPDWPYYRVRTSLTPVQSLLILRNELEPLPCQACGQQHPIQQCPAIGRLLEIRL